MLNEQVLLLSKRHGQLKQAITKMVQVVMSFLDDTQSLETKLSVIETLRTVTEGKVRTSQDHLLISTYAMYRSLSKSSEHESQEYFQTLRNSRAISRQHVISSVNYRSKHLVR